MPPSAIKLIWSISACNFCPRTGVRTCQIKPGKLLSKLSSALDLDESVLDSSEGICTCCLADIDMIIRAVAIRGAMKDYFMDVVQNTHRRRYSGSASIAMTSNSYSNGHYLENNMIAHSMGGQMLEHIDCAANSQSDADQSHPPPPLLVARPALNNTVEGVLPQKNQATDRITAQDIEISSVPTPAKKPKERHTRYQCILCEKIAGSKSHCMEHLICHSPVRPFTCSHCMKTYKSRKACREHLIVMHGVEKVEEKLQKLVIIDHEGLKQLEQVCTQFRRIFSPPAAAKLVNERPSSASSTIAQTKLEPEERDRPEIDGGSAWLYAPLSSEPSRLPPPLLQCGPTASPAFNNNKSETPSHHDAIPPPSKRTRKGTPHKLVHELPDEVLPEVLDLERVESHMDDSDDTGSIGETIDPKSYVPSKDASKDGWFENAQDDNYSNIKASNQPFFPSFSTISATDSLSFPVNTNRQSPTAGSRKNVPPCERCGRCFPTKEKMADHMRSHSEVKQFSCLVCNRFFKYRRGVTNHLKEVHHLTDRNEISSKVASHEIGIVIQSKAAKHRERKAMLNQPTSIPAGVKLEQGENCETDTSISQKMIQDTLSSLADIQEATENANLPVFSSDESNNADSIDHSGVANDYDNQSDTTGEKCDLSSAVADEALKPEHQDELIISNSHADNTNNQIVTGASQLAA